MCTTMVLGPRGAARSQEDRSALLAAAHAGLRAVNKTKPGYLIVLLQPFLHAKRPEYPVYPCQSEIMMLFLFV